MNDTNPYASPQSFPQYQPPLAPNQPVVPASQGRRFANFIIDNIIVRVLAFGAGMAVGFIALAAGTQQEAFDGLGFTIISALVGILTVMAYYIVMEATLGRTLGKFVSGTKVVSADGGRPTIGQIVGRNFARLIPFEPFSFFGNEAVGWHDTLSKTRVVNV